MLELRKTFSHHEEYDDIEVIYTGSDYNTIIDISYSGQRIDISLDTLTKIVVAGERFSEANNLIGEE